jgi:hypothetical protein
MNFKTTQGTPDVASPETTEIAVPVESTTPETTPAAKPKASRKPKGEITLADLAERYIKHLGDEGKSPGTCSSYAAELKLAIKHLGGDTQIASLTPAQVGEFFESKPVTKLRSGKKKSQLSIDKTRRVLRLALVWAAQKRWIESAPIPQAAEQA